MAEQPDILSEPDRAGPADLKNGLMSEVRALLQRLGVRARVECKVNRDGRYVIGVILDNIRPPPPDPSKRTKPTFR